MSSDPSDQPTEAMNVAGEGSSRGNSVTRADSNRRAPARGADEIGTHQADFGDYEILSEIARGGMGVVYRARQKSLDRIVALKMILAGQFANQDQIARFQAEAKAAAKLNHPGIVAIYEIGDHDGRPYFTMDFCEGESLAEMIRDVVLAPEDAAEIVLELAEAIEYAHQQGILHRDLKPSNVMMPKGADFASRSSSANRPTSDAGGSGSGSGNQPVDDVEDERRKFGDIKITDFGLARQIQSESNLTGTGQALGTPSYMPPEQASGDRDKIGPPSDVYSLGAILYELVTGRPPFQAETPLDTILQVLEVEPVSPRLLNPAVPRDIETITLKCLSKLPEERYASAEALADELHRFIDDEPIQARPIGWVERLWRRSRKHQKTIRALSVAMTLVIFTVVGVIFGRGLYRDLNTGTLSVATDGFLARGELRDRDGRLVSVLNLPTTEPIPLDAKNYQLNWFAPGRLSEAAQVSIHAAQQRNVSIDPSRRHLWEPMAIDRQDLIGFARRDAGYDLLLFTRNFGHPTLRRLRGDSRTLVWDLTLDPTRPHVSSLRESQPGMWDEFVADWPADVSNQSGIIVLDHPADINEDGQSDVVLMTPGNRSIVALDGSDGRLIWRVASPEGWMWSTGSEMVFLPGQLMTPQVLGAVAEKSGANQLVLIDAQDGSVLAEKPWMPLGSAAGAGGDPLAPLLRSATIGSVPWLVTAAENQFELIEPDNGEAISIDGLPSGFTALLHVEDLDGDNSDEALLLQQTAQSATSLIHAVSLKDRRLLWSVEVDTPANTYRTRLDRSASAATSNIFATAGSGADRGVVIPVVRNQGEFDGDAIEVIFADAATGAPRWRKDLRLDRAVFHAAIPTKDLDCDGSDDVAVIASGMPRAGMEHFYLYVDVLSSRDGSSIGFWHRRLEGTRFAMNKEVFHDVDWWGRDSQGWPQLALFTRHVRSGRPEYESMYVVSLSSWKVRHELTHATVQLVDLDGDGLRDLCYRPTTEDNRRLFALRGTPPELWHRLDRAFFASDYDLDGRADLIEVIQGLPTGKSIPGGAESRVFSGADGRVLAKIPLDWKHGQYSFQFNYTVPAADVSDLDGDGVGDVLVYSSTRYQTPVPSNDRLQFDLGLQSLSVAKQNRIWLADPMECRISDNTSLEEIAAGVPINVDYVSAKRLRGDSSIDLVCGFSLMFMDSGDNTGIAIYDGRTGEHQWSRLIARHVYGRSFDLNHYPVQAAIGDGDFNDDGVVDLVFSVAELDRDSSQHRQSIHIYDGATGDALIDPHPLDSRLPHPLPSSQMQILHVMKLDGASPEIVWIEPHAKADHSETIDRLQIFNAGTRQVRLSLSLGTHDPKRRLVSCRRPNSVELPMVFPLTDEFEGATDDVQSNDAPVTEAVVFAATGEVELRFGSDVLPCVSDLDGDGRDEFIGAQGDLLLATSGVDQPLWRRKMRSPIKEVLPWLRSSHGSPSEVVVMGTQPRDLYGVRLADGQPVWRVVGLREDFAGRSDRWSEQVFSSWAEDRHHLPLVVHDDGTLTGRLAFPVRDDGTFDDQWQPSEPVRCEFRDPRLYRRFPWAARFTTGDDDNPVTGALKFYFVIGLLGFFLVWLPVGLLTRFYLRRRWSLTEWLALPVVAGAAFACAQLYVRYGKLWDVWGYIYVEDSPWMGLLWALLGAVLVCTPAILLLCAVGQQWRLLVLFGAYILLAAIVNAGAMLAIDMPTLSPGEQYRWDYWYTLLFTAPFIAGPVFLLVYHKRLRTRWHA